MGGVRPNASKKGQIGPSTTVWAARGDGSCPNCASALQGARETANIQAGSGVIWRISAYIYLPFYNPKYRARPDRAAV
jgi:sugar (pentulose or hexulose) kinase